MDEEAIRVLREGFASMQLQFQKLDKIDDLDKTIADLNKEMALVLQELYGMNRSNGMRSRVAHLEQEVAKLKLKIWFYAGGITTGVFIIQWIIKLITKQS